MADLTIFYSWQSDLPRKLSRDVIHAAAQQAIGQLRLDASIDDAPRLDHDTQGVAGVPEIAGTIFKKIDQCGAFIADLSFIGISSPSDPDKPAKKLPNPNVLLELGYAAGVIGWDRIILVMNEHFGSPDDLIFDLKHRRFPLTFKLEPTSRKDVAAVTGKLSGRLQEAIRSALESEHEAVQRAIARLDTAALRWLREEGRSDTFSVPQRSTMGDVLSYLRLDDAVVRLIELKLLQCDVAAGGDLTGYKWTYLGKLVLKKLGLRGAAEANQSAGDSAVAPPAMPSAAAATQAQQLATAAWSATLEMPPVATICSTIPPPPSDRNERSDETK